MSVCDDACVPKLARKNYHKSVERRVLRTLRGPGSAPDATAPSPHTANMPWVLDCRAGDQVGALFRRIASACERVASCAGACGAGTARDRATVQLGVSHAVFSVAERSAPAIAWLCSTRSLSVRSVPAAPAHTGNQFVLSTGKNFIGRKKGAW